MRRGILATIGFAALALFLAVREITLNNRIKSLRREKEEELTVLSERLERAEQKLDQASDQVSSKAELTPTSGVGEHSGFPQRITALEEQVRALQAKVSPEYDPTIQTPEPEPETNTVKRGWGPEQALGPPDTEQNTDSMTAWTSLEPDGGPEWLMVGFDRTVELGQVRIRESYNPGAITKVTTIVNGTELVLWEGVSAPAKAVRDFVVRSPGGLQANSVVVYLDTKRVPGWNEIDAIELVGSDGSRQWATSAQASSSYADRMSAREWATPLLR